MVRVDNINSLNSDSLYKFTFNLDGEYEENSASVEATFTLNDTSVSNAQYTLTSKTVEKEGSYVAEIPLSDFDVYQDKRFNVELMIGFKPEISAQTMSKWSEIFGSEENPLSWLDYMLNAVEHTNFFENRATEYARASTTGNWKDIFK